MVGGEFVPSVDGARSTNRNWERRKEVRCPPPHVTRSQTASGSTYLRVASCFLDTPEASFSLSGSPGTAHRCGCGDGFRSEASPRGNGAAHPGQGAFVVAGGTQMEGRTDILHQEAGRCLELEGFLALHRSRRFGPTSAAQAVGHLFEASKARLRNG